MLTWPTIRLVEQTEVTMSFQGKIALVTGAGKGLCLYFNNFN